MTTQGTGPPWPVTGYFLRLGAIAFGGPAAHIALMRRELVEGRRWVSEQQFTDMLAVTNLIPGPNSTEMAMHIGGLRAGWRGVWLAGLAFISPAIVIVLGLAIAYDRWGATPNGRALMQGIAPVVLAILVQAIWGLRRAVVARPATFVAAAVAVGLHLAGAAEVVALLGVGLAALLLHGVSSGRLDPGWPRRLRDAVERLSFRLAVAVPAGLSMEPSAVFAAAARASDYSDGALFLVFLKIGSVLYGSGYVLVSFLQADLVDARGWLTQQQLVDALAVGQFTPGPLFTTATFVGYQLGGLSGAAVATIGIFLPAFLFVAVTHPLVPRLRQWRWTRPFLDAVSAAAVGLMALVTIELGRPILDGPAGWAAFLIAGGVLLRFRPNSAWLVIAGAAYGLALHAVGAW